MACLAVALLRLVSDGDKCGYHKLNLSTFIQMCELPHFSSSPGIGSAPRVHDTVATYYGQCSMVL